MSDGRLLCPSTAIPSYRTGRCTSLVMMCLSFVSSCALSLTNPRREFLVSLWNMHLEQVSALSRDLCIGSALCWCDCDRSQQFSWQEICSVDVCLLLVILDALFVRVLAVDVDQHRGENPTCSLTYPYKTGVGIAPEITFLPAIRGRQYPHHQMSSKSHKQDLH